MLEQFTEYLQAEIATLKSEGLYKSERVISSQQQADVTVNHKEVINLCANNYLGLANDPKLIAEGQKALAQYGYGMASVRFICGTQTPHKQLEQKISQFLSKEDTILYSSCFDANTGLFETLLGEEDAIISDALNHASIIDGVRLCKAARYRYANNDMKALEEQLIAAKNARFRLIATDGVFSMDGILANLPAICELADKYDAMVMVDDSHAVGFMGENGRGTPEHFGVSDRIDIITGTLGKALGGASGGYTTSNQTIVDWLRQRSRPYLFSNTLAPVIAHTSCIVLDNLMKDNHLAEKLKRNSRYFREGMSKLGFQLIPGEHPIIPVMLGDASLAGRMANRLLELGIYVVGFSYPVVPKGLARIRTQMSAAHELHHLDKAIEAFEIVGKEFSVI
ncbi:glycine C-acetyltransferase [Fluoribacter dumoffii]|uniref:2-amino-3-ketobutyrate coenzyme A ligase n=1 Tax=Fluoribacter dumoffii TaxID=463 RepID=A0A377G7G3_9GAMM|nr:glycine C-acetyltransferase [Fluoribacter dumoffii]KTC89650.1 2-amino-3-ketobutyrate CoA ligase [Fluoribacter dumoffii NY 23]MCW8384843.1 glycine C-acetyltransferase [Fluoribacter dumoffii]MCW8417906.1 glycine C-acetyltransferase [Fluoribacter dumoffii]MCW8454252.1 glycine C-acetyltransferase [Fluoribacter dumoffii]MCW8461674.1 glycine C-acetyltransferase [Fluoribacter dumoffii]